MKIDTDDIKSGEALFHLAEAYEDAYGVPRNRDLAIELYKQSIALGYGKSDYHLGFMLSHEPVVDGEDIIEDDYEEAEKWYRIGAELGDADAQYEAGCIEEDWDKATEWFLKSALQGNPYPAGELSRGGTVKD